jgi:superfamily II DNA/RNA helicase
VTTSKRALGKTLAYLLPIVQRLLEIETAEGMAAEGHVRALVLVPSAELAQQVLGVLRGVANRKLRVSIATGGNKWQTQRERLAGGLEVLIATFGRLQAHLEAQTFTLSALRCV